MPTINDIRTRYQNGDTITQISRDLGLDRKTVRKYIMKNDFSPGMELPVRRGSKVDAYDDTIRGFLDEDMKTWRKQRHTAQRIYERLRDEYGYTGSYETVQRRVKAIREQRKATLKQPDSQKDVFLPLEWKPGIAQVDFGEVELILAGERERWHALVVSFPYSNVGYAQVFSGETAECVCHGLRSVFEHIGGTPLSLIFDNATGVGKKIMGDVRLTELFAQFQLHYGFEYKFCNPYSAHEKGNVERSVFKQRSHLFVPAPEVNDVEKFNAELLAKSVWLNDKTHYRKEVNQFELFEEDLGALRELPPSPFNCCRYVERKTNKYGHVQVDGNHFYSTKPELAQTTVTVEIGARLIRIFGRDGKQVAEHRRQFGKKRTESIDQSTTLAALKRRPGAWEQCGVRQTVSDALQAYIDGTTGKERREALELLDELNAEFGFETAVNALTRAVENGRVERDSTMVLAAWMSDERYVPFRHGVSLDVYDMFIPQGGVS